ncbi:hypothetical protein [Hymenobacter chitinivorans]|uniref:SdpC family antimicrobial peptide n=1 Tax=Hymenobacter chitinivorans DSM 11115 TaxID=1121954 RepID=A0A2M9BMP4_9BACT|nr:hypothetical protein [Hymenobacter chitinivorans]PJJ59218.1 SdpC family antimicrobial peptide [Hymenobacter chitinivorans DSM 11115]
MFTYIRNSGISKAAMMLGLTSFLAVSCSKDELQAPAPAASSSVQASVSGETLFRGIFLMEGKIATKLHTLDAFRLAMEKAAKSDPNYVQNRLKGNNYLVALVRKLDPNYFDELKAAVASQDFAKIDVTMRKGGMLIQAAALGGRSTGAVQERKALVESMDLTKYDFKQEASVTQFMQDAKQKLAESGTGDEASLMQQDELEMCLTVAAVVAAVVWEAVAVVNVAVVATVAVYAAALLWRPAGTDATDGPGNLEKEQFIKEIALSLN